MSYNLRYAWDVIIHPCSKYLLLAQNPVCNGYVVLQDKQSVCKHLNWKTYPLQIWIKYLALGRYRVALPYWPYSDPFLTSYWAHHALYFKSWACVWVRYASCQIIRLLPSQPPIGLRRVVTLTRWGEITSRKAWDFAREIHDAIRATMDIGYHAMSQCPARYVLLAAPNHAKNEISISCGNIQTNNAMRAESPCGKRYSRQSQKRLATPCIQFLGSAPYDQLGIGAIANHYQAAAS